MKYSKVLTLILMLAVLSGCASVLSGTSQTITVNSEPQGAECKLIREGNVIQTVPATPTQVSVEKSKHDITVECTKPGYGVGKGVINSGSSMTTAGNILLGGGIGWAIDSARGADNLYDESVTVGLPQLQQQY